MPVTEHGQDNEIRQSDNTAIMRRAPQHVGGRPDRVSPGEEEATDYFLLVLRRFHHCENAY